MVEDKKLFTLGSGLLVAFFIVLFLMFMPFFKEGNTLNYMDNLYNMISKGSAYYIPKLSKEAEKFKGKQIRVEIDMKSEKRAADTALLFQKSGAAVTPAGTKLNVGGDLGPILTNVLQDADFMFNNNGKAVKDKYGYDEKWVLYNWSTAITEMDRDLKKQTRFEEASAILNIQKKGVDCAYNYYGIKAEKIMDKIGIVLFSLVFYVVYTLWFGFSIMFMFEGWGMKMSH